MGIFFRILNGDFFRFLFFQKMFIFQLEFVLKYPKKIFQIFITSRNVLFFSENFS